jgi:hypothetical protein
MATEGGPKIVSDGLVLCLDAANLKSYTEDKNVLDVSSWVVGTGSVYNFNRNGSSSENYRIIGEDPFGNDAVLWEARPGSSSGADGGWNSDRFNIDNTKLYRFSTWVKRTVYEDGRFYLGTRGYGSTNGVLSRSNGNNSTNPYFYYSADPPSTSQLPQDTWVLVVGHIWPHGSGVGPEHPDSGRYTKSNGKIGGIFRDYVWRSETTQSIHRSYLFYSSQTSPRQRWVYPRVDIIDGTQPTIDDLLNNRINERYLFDASNNNNNGTLINGIQSDAQTIKSLKFDGQDDTINLKPIITLGSGWSVESWVYLIEGSQYTHIFSSQTAQQNFACKIAESGDNLKPYFYKSGTNTFSITSKGLELNKWHHIVYTYNGTSVKVFLDGDEIASLNSSLDIGPGTYMIGNSGSTNEYNKFKMSSISVKNKPLTSSEITQNYNAKKSRYNL